MRPALNFFFQIWPFNKKVWPPLFYIIKLLLISPQAKLPQYEVSKFKMHLIAIFLVKKTANCLAQCWFVGHHGKWLFFKSNYLQNRPSFILPGNWFENCDTNVDDIPVSWQKRIGFS